MVDSIRQLATPGRLALGVIIAEQAFGLCLAVPLAVALLGPVMGALVLASYALPVLLVVRIKRAWSARRAYRAAVKRRLAWA